MMAKQLLSRWWGRVGAALLLAALLVAVATGASSLTAEDEKAEALPADLAKIPSDGMLVLSGRVADLWGSEFLKSAREKYKKEIDEDLIKAFQDYFGLPVEQVERMTLLMLGVPPTQGGPLVFVRTVKPYDLAKIVAKVTDAKVRKYKEEMLYVGEKGWTIYPLDDRSLVFGVLRDVNALIDHPQAKKGGNLASVVRLAAGKHSVVLGMNVKLLTSVGNQLPAEIEPFLPLLQAFSATFSANFAADSRADAVLTFASDDDAKSALKPADAGLVLLRAGLGNAVAALTKQEDKEAKELAGLLKQLQEPLKSVRIEQKDATLRASVVLKMDPAAVGLTLVQVTHKMRESASRAQSMNNLKQFALAIHNYAATMGGQLPAHAIYSKDGKPLLSWRVAILPFIEQKNLYDQFHLNEAWNSEHNIKLLALMPKTYAHPADEKAVKDHLTYYQAFVGKRAFFEGKQGLRFPAAFTDGTSNTIMFVEASKAVPWTKPEDLPFDPEKPLPKLGLPGFKYFLAAMCDGSVRAVSHTVSKETLRNAITRDGGEILGADW